MTLNAEHAARPAAPAAAEYSDVVLPNLGFGMEEGRVLAWLKATGDPVRKGDAIAEIESDKAAVELQAVVDGVLDAILVPADQVAAVGEVLARIRTGGAPDAALPATGAPAAAADPVSAPSDDDAAGRASPIAVRMAREHGIALADVPGTGPGGRILRQDVEEYLARAGTHAPAPQGGRALAAPAVRRAAREQGIDLRTIRGTGPDGRVTRADLQAALRAPATPTAASTAPKAPTAPTLPTAPGKPVAPAAHAPPAAEPAPGPAYRHEAPLTPLRRTIARRMTQSAQEAPHFNVTAQLDLSAALRALRDGIGVNALLLYLTVRALGDVPAMNATFEDGKLYHYDQINLSIAVAIENGLISPVLARAEDYSLSGLAHQVKDLVSRTRAGQLRPEELGGGTFTVSNLGVVPQVERFTAILNPPQVGILAFGTAADRPLVIDGGLHIRKTIYVTLSADHRAVDGMVGARFLEALDTHLQAFTG